MKRASSTETLPAGGQRLSFQEWIANRPEISNLLDKFGEIERPFARAESDVGQLSQEDRVVATRAGNVSDIINYFS
jgi:hypothetical protein